jgi:hypothetical protein
MPRTVYNGMLVAVQEMQRRKNNLIGRGLITAKLVLLKAMNEFIESISARPV